MGLEEAILQEVREQGIEQGIEQNKRTVIIRSHEKDMPITDIAEITEMTVEEVEQIMAINTGGNPLHLSAMAAGVELPALLQLIQ
jgi:predicted transposase YdaD